MTRLKFAFVSAVGALSLAACETASLPGPAPAAPTAAKAGVQTLEAGPIWDNANAQTVCPGLAAKAGARWTGGWWTTVPNEMSVCEVDFASPGSGSNDLNADYSGPTRFFFEQDSAVLNAEAKAHLSDLARTLQQEVRNIRIEGHVRKGGDRYAAMALGEERASAVAQFLKSKGVAPGSVEIISYGSERPAESGDHDYAHRANDHVEIKF